MSATGDLIVGGASGAATRLAIGSTGYVPRVVGGTVAWREISAAGSATYRLYEAQCRWLETSDGGTAVLYLRSSTGARVGTAQYTPDYESGRFAFAADTGGSVLYLTARAYDVQAAAADVWQQKAAHVADRFDFSADGASFKASQLVAQYERQAAACAAQASFGAAGVQSITLMRDDVRGVWD
jgi:hypothetical protein